MTTRRSHRTPARRPAPDGSSPGATASPRGSAAGDGGAGTVAADGDGMTEFQRLIWAGERLHAGLDLFQVPLLFTVNAALDPALFARAFASVVAASDALRTVFEETDGTPRARVLASVDAAVEVVDLAGTPDPEAAADAWCQARRKQGFDLTRRVFDCALLRLGGERTCWYLNLHHIAADMAAAALVFRAVDEEYGRVDRDPHGSAGRKLPSFQARVRAAQRHRGSAAHRRGEAYWSARRADAVEPPAPYGRTRRPGSTRIARVPVDLGQDRMRALQLLAAGRRIARKTPEGAFVNLLLALLGATLCRVSGQRRIAVGVSFANRRSEIERRTIGLFMHVLPIEVATEEGDTLTALWDRVDARAAEALRHRDVVVRNPLGDRAWHVGMTFHTATFPRFAGAAVDTRWLHPDHAFEALTLYCHDWAAAGSPSLELFCNSDLLDEPCRQALTRHFRRVADAVLADPGVEVDAIELLDHAEQTALAHASRGPITALDEASVVELVTRRAREAPASTALIAGGRDVPYAELAAMSERVARGLAAAGLAPGEPVALCSGRSPELPAGLLGILAAGGVAVLLDPASPPARLAHILADSGSRHLLADAAALARLNDFTGTRLLLPTAAREGAAGGALPAPRRGDDPAYLVYTSGSSGRPKGVIGHHRGLANYFAYLVPTFGLGPADTVLQLAALGFDASLRDLLAPLVAGARLVLPADDDVLDPGAVLGALDRHRVTCLLSVVPTALRGLLAEARGGRPRARSLRLVLTTGEVLTFADVRGVREAFGAGVEIVNLYGPTETTLTASFHRLGPDEDGEGAVPIGHPIHNVDLRVLDARLRPVPPGVPGELVIGGAGVTHGYVGKPDLTARAFLPDPFRGGAALMYRTGDLGRLGESGAIEFLGRRDDQVKVRGVRVELAEVEAALHTHPAVAAAAVACHPGRDGVARLTAYVVVRGGAATSADALRRHAARALPSAFVPSVFMFVTDLPRTATGKLDRRSLPPPPENVTTHGRSVADPVVARVAAVWEEVLGIGPVGPDDDFFALGGHSLLVVRIFSRLERQFGRRVPLAALFDAVTPAQQAALLRFR